MFEVTNYKNSLDLLRPNFIGFDSMFDEMERLFNEPVSNFPVYDLYTQEVNVAEKGKEKKLETHWIFKFALAGVDRSRLSVFFDPDDHTLSVKCAKAEKGDPTIKYLHNGIAQRSFEFTRTISSDLELYKCSTAEVDGPGCLVVEFRQKDKPQKKSTRVDIEY